MDRVRPAPSKIQLEGDDPVKERRVREWFSFVAARASDAAGSAWAFALAILVIVVWAVSGPFFGFSDTWQLIINTGTTIVTFLMVFLIQNTQNKDTIVVHVKLNELIASQPGASNTLIDLEDMSEADLERLRVAFQRLADMAEQKEARGRMTVEEMLRTLGEHKPEGPRKGRSPSRS
ncbi:MAG TPA: low affinity iron permease family protein [Candidatus Thermoplasmatota archaeon]|nr:low affinity iron permease family protein [Candidatus Thermoplasmatota archaeon]